MSARITIQIPEFSVQEKDSINQACIDRLHCNYLSAR